MKTVPRCKLFKSIRQGVAGCQDIISGTCSEGLRETHGDEDHSEDEPRSSVVFQEESVLGEELPSNIYQQLSCL